MPKSNVKVDNLSQESSSSQNLNQEAKTNSSLAPVSDINPSQASIERNYSIVPSQDASSDQSQGCHLALQTSNPSVTLHSSKPRPVLENDVDRPYLKSFMNKQKVEENDSEQLNESQNIARNHKSPRQVDSNTYKSSDVKPLQSHNPESKKLQVTV